MRGTIAEKILARASGRKEVSAGEYVTAKIDLAMTHDWTFYVANILERLNIDRVWDPNRIVVVLDHYVPVNEQVAKMHKTIRNFVKKYGIKYFYEFGTGICHQVLCEKGHVCPGELIVGTDSHTTTYGALGAASTGIGVTEMAVVFATGELWFRVPETIQIYLEGKLSKYVMTKDLMLYLAGKYGTDFAQYKSIEFHGPAIKNLSIDSRMTMSNMAIELGAKFGIIPPDEKTINYVKKRTKKSFIPIRSDSDANYEKTIEVNLGNLEPMVALPHDLSNSVPVSKVEDIEINQAFLGSCTNGRLEDLKIAAEIMKGKHVHPNVRMIVIPASKEVFIKALEMGIIEILMKAGAIIYNSTCGPCYGGMLGYLASGERCISSSNRNFKGRMGSKDSEIYLASPATVAASAIKGKITNPLEVIN